jgi:DNA invertase Pin-like site-specific DNA recombinase
VLLKFTKKPYYSKYENNTARMVYRGLHSKVLNMSMIGYARVSTDESKQLLDRQLDALNLAGCERIFEDHSSGSDPDRPGLISCIDYLRSNDVLSVLDLDRLGRLARELLELIDELEARGIGFKAINSPMDTTTPAGRAFLQIQAAFAEMERNLIKQRVKEGLAAARARGRNGGRPRIMTVDKLKYAQQLMKDKSKSIPDICKELGGIPSSTLYHYVHADGKLKKPGHKLLNG